MKVLQIGAGSMGSRRMRDLSSREGITLAVFDEREERRAKAQQRYGAEGFERFEDALGWQPDAIVISTPPHLHTPYIEAALSYGLHFFCEADIWTYDYREVERIAAAKRIVAAPSCTLFYHPVVAEVKRIVAEELGALHTYAMCLSVDAPGWHPGEGAEYYARSRNTSAGREMVPFELIGLNAMFGEPRDVFGTVQRRGSLAIGAEDTWCLQLMLDSGATGQLQVLMASPQTMRRGWAGGTNGFVEFDLIAGEVTRRLPRSGIDNTRRYGRMSDILESVYAREIGAFVEAVEGKAPWPYSYRQSSVATATLAAAERSALTGRLERVDPLLMPEQLPEEP